ncbi:MAG: amino acid adenylation domain-containing protein [Oscillospiraceae bacterium]|nr:amino acid adenylation domain-containing protein [Oscillospiraceae bacterium]
MLTNVMQYLEQTLPRVPDKTAFANEECALTFRQVSDQARSIASHLHREGFYKKPVVVFMKKHPKTIVAFFGTIYAGCYYVPLDEEMPRHRIELIFQTLQPGAIICDDTTREMIHGFNYSGKTYLYDDICTAPVDEAALAAIRDRQIDTDPIYIVFTSGSTGVPKGVMACHRSVIDYIEHLSEVLRFNEDTVFGNQTPLYFDACLKEVYPTLKYGATTYIIPKQLFMFPIKLVEFLNRYRINTVCWVVSALTMISSFRTFEKIKPEYLHTIAFASEVFPIKQFNLWRAALPNARFINLYGPTEVTGICCYYEVDREFSLEESLPVGKPFRNTDIILLDENNKEPAPGEQGEICVRGTCLTLGYYRNPEKTAEAFVQNPLNDLYPELIYRTGDLGKYNERGELVFLSRKDFQIKHMGHRIELGEIEVIVNMHPQVHSACCLFDNEKKKIILFYAGDAAPGEMTAYIKEKLPRYMVPNVVRRLDTMPLTPNGKIDRNLLKTQYENKEN